MHRKLLSVAYFIALILCVVYVLSKVSAQEFEYVILERGNYVWLLIVGYFIWLFFETTSLKILLRNKVTRPELLKIYLAGEAYNILTPFLGYGGDPLRVQLLSDTKKVDASLSGSAIVTFKYLDALAATLVGISSLIYVAFTYNELDPFWKNIIQISILLYVIIIGVLSIGMKKSAPRFISKKLISLFNLKGNSENYDQLTMIRCLGIQCLSRMATFVDLMIICFVLNISWSLSDIVFLAAFSSLSTVLFFFVPNGVGTKEFLYSKSTELIHLGTSAGLKIILLLRFKQLFWAVIGLLIHLITTSKILIKK